MDKEKAQTIAQLLVEYDSTVEGEWGYPGKPEALEEAKYLYQEFGPFELEFKDWCDTQPPIWYNE